MRRLEPFFGVQILNLNIFGGFQENEYFSCMKILWIGKGIEWGTFIWGAKILNIFWGT